MLRNIFVNLFLCFSLSLSLVSCAKKSSSKVFPFELSDTKPKGVDLSASMERLYNNYSAVTNQKNELYTQFKYSMPKGFDYHNDDGTISKRDPTRIVKANGKYYMWYTLRNTPTTYVGADKANDTIPSTDWDLCDIGYATSKDGFTWQEQGVAFHRPEKPLPGWRSVCTPEILVWKGKYYLYFQAFKEMSGKRGDDCPVACAVADSPDGPFKYVNKIIIPNGKPGEWDQYSIHDPLPIVFKGKIYFYYKSDYNGKPNLIRSHGLAIGDNPLGPFVKCKKNPISSSGHETQYFRFKKGIAAILERDGVEASTIQFSNDGINFNIASVINMPPDAAGVYDPDAFNDSEDARGISWGMMHSAIWGPNRHSVLVRFDCDLSLDVNDPYMKKNIGTPTLKEHLAHGLNNAQKKRIIKENTLK